MAKQTEKLCVPPKQELHLYTDLSLPLSHQLPKKTTQKGQQRDNKAKYKDTTTNEASNHRNTQLGSVLSAKTPWEVSELGTSPTNRTRAKVVKFIQSRWSRWPPVASPHAGAAGTFAAHRGRQRGHVNRERKVPEGSPGNQGGS